MNIRNFTDIKSLLLDNKSAKQTIFKNTFWLGLTGVIQKGISFLVVVWLARHFGPVIYGKWAFALSFTALFAFLPNFGFGLLTIRELARDKAKTAEYLDNIIMMKVVLGLIALGFVAVIIQFLGKDLEVIKLVYFLGIYTVLNTFADFFQSIFRANQKMQYETLCQGMRGLSLIGLVGFFILNKSPILSISYAYIGAVLIGILFSLLFIWRYFSKFFLKIDLKICKEILKKAWPFALSVLLSVIYFKISIVFLSVMRGDYEVGIYSPSYNLILLSFILPEYLTISIYPYFSKLFVEDKHKLIDNFFRMFKLFLSAGLIIFLLIALLAPFVIKVIYGSQYQDSIIVLQILSISVLLAYLAYPAGVSLSSVNLQKYRVKGQFLSAGSAILANLILIPIFGIYGVIYSFIISEAILGVSYYYFFYKKFCRIYLRIS